MKSFKPLSNRRGQGLIEYLILTALLAVATMSIVRLLGHSVSAKFAQVTKVIQGRTEKEVKIESVEDSDFKKKDMSDFMNGAASSDRKKK